MDENWQDYRPTLTMRCTQCGDTFTSDETHDCLSVEQMIAAIGDVNIHPDADDGWIAGTMMDLADGGAVIHAQEGPTVYEALAALYRAWRQRNGD